MRYLLLLGILILSVSATKSVTLDVAYSPDVSPCYTDWAVSFIFEGWSGIIGSRDTKPIHSPYNGPFKVQVVNGGMYVPEKSNYGPYLFVYYGCEALVILGAYPDTGCQGLYWYPINNINCNSTL